MIKPTDKGIDYLNFECDDCGSIFHHTIKISHDAPTQTDAQRYDVRNWTIMRIHLKCPKCGDEGSFKLVLREDLSAKK